ncbi:hypothetical protein AAG906_005388 [Vitis piasezkii]
MTTRGVRSPTAIHFTIDGRHGVLEPDDPSAFRQWSPVSQKDMVHILSKGTSTDAIFLEGASTWDAPRRCGATLQPLSLITFSTEGFYFGLHHLIMASLIHFEEKVVVPNPRVFGLSSEPRLERRHLCRERFTLDKWNQLAGYSTPPGVPSMVAPPMPPQPKHDELPVETAPLVLTPEATSTAPPMTSTIPPVAPTTFEPSITISASEFRVLPDLPTSLAPIAPVEDTTPVEVRIPPPQDEPPTVTATPKEASSPPEAPTT